ncbi:lytic polysaccharide monooxygenase auxiliary activity family 9 protein [Actinoplanes regularis]|uniref:Chitin-binding protein n=1 Tax=Actinoplanes regularis TaxID=52697 RepID=A0A238Z4A5_9ACTN|nr:lytic polysaccharide monooxygenase [Actinoplanes regularis]GIE85780.1 chitin-binding protein [Actinoplanes regularis]GLW29409.1 chitin-binding protein [Actinoplanes regularis]SNR77778.1 chitin-binding protein [Actinoplanes regularis]
MPPRASDQSGRPSRSAAHRPVQVLIVVLATLAGMLPWTGTAQAHGTIINPASRAYQCWKTWGNQHTNPAMQQQDPMCWQAFQANPDTMWNWMSALRDGLAGQFQARTPDGQLCSNGLTRNDSLNQLGAWKQTTVSRNLTVQLYDQASHGADYFRVYVSKQGFNPATQRLGWGNLDFITQTGKYAPAQNISFNISTSGYTGHHILFVIWQASHQDQTYMWCSDVNFA